MHDCLFYSSSEHIDAVVSEISDAKKNNTALFRKVSKEIFAKSFSKIEFHNSLDLGARMLGAGIVCAIKKSKGQYKAGSFAKSFNKTNPYANHVTGSDLRILLKFLNDAEFDTVLKLLKHNHRFGFKSCLNMLP